MLAGFAALLADDVAPVITDRSPGGQTTYWTGGPFCSADPDDAARFRSADDAVATLIVLRASGVLGKTARVVTVGSWDEAMAGLLRL